MHSFETYKAAKEFVSERVDVPALERVENMGEDFTLHAFSQDLGEGKFTNVYDLSFPATRVRPSIELHNQLTSVYDYVRGRPDIKAATGGGFFFLADRANATPRHFGLNLSLLGGQLYSFPVVDREAVLISNERLDAEILQAHGVLEINSSELTWSGSLTGYGTDVKVFANGNSAIRHIQDNATGSIRVLEESSRYTPAINTDDTVDIGFIRRDDGVFVGISSSSTGSLDIFSHDVVMRTHERHAHRALPEMHVRTLGGKALGSSLNSAMSVGPMLNTEDFAAHPINRDASLGNKPPFIDVPLARTVLYEPDDGTVHLQLFDGRPGSPVFPGVTPDEAARLIKARESLRWGCFLDPGQTAKLVVRDDKDIASYGNTHYLTWPKHTGEKYVWTPKAGRPVASMIALR